MACIHRAKQPENCKYCYRKAHPPTPLPRYHHPRRVDSYIKQEVRDLRKKLWSETITPEEFRRLRSLLSQYRNYVL